MASRERNQVETRMLAEYLASAYPNVEYITNPPLGAPDETVQRQVGYERALGLTHPYRPKADAIVILPRHMVLVESKVWNVVGGAAKLPLYKSLIPTTPELKQFFPRDVIMELVVGWTNTNLETMCSSTGISIKVFSPPWLGEVVARMHNYWTAEYRQKRAEVIARRKFFGVE